MVVYGWRDRVNDSDTWDAVEYATPGQTATNYITLEKNPYNPDQTEWTFSFTGLDRYANGADGKVDNTKVMQLLYTISGKIGSLFFHAQEWYCE